MNEPNIIVRNLGVQDFRPVWLNMRQFVAERKPNSRDEIWLTEHRSVFTQGQAGKASHILQTASIPIIQTDRGGQVTYHGIGQLIFYLMLNLNQHKSGIKHLITAIENSVLDYLHSLNINAYTKRGAPGIYTSKGKIAFLGLKVSRGYTYHGLSFNFNLVLEPFTYINPCGYPKLAITNLAFFNTGETKKTCQQKLSQFLCTNLSDSN